MAKVAITITFDLHNVKPTRRYAVYSGVKKGLAAMKMNKYVISSSGNQTNLPSNTFVGFLRGPNVARMSVGNIRLVVMKKVKTLIAQHHKPATVFVVVGRNWAWGRGRVK